MLLLAGELRRPRKSPALSICWKALWPTSRCGFGIYFSRFGVCVASNDTLADTLASVAGAFPVQLLRGLPHLREDRATIRRGQCPLLHVPRKGMVPGCGVFRPSLDRASLNRQAGRSTLPMQARLCLFPTCWIPGQASGCWSPCPFAMAAAAPSPMFVPTPFWRRRRCFVRQVLSWLLSFAGRKGGRKPLRQHGLPCL